MQRHDDFIQSRLATVPSVIDQGIDNGKTSFVFYCPVGIVVKKPATLWNRRTWEQTEVTGWGTQLLEILNNCGLDTAWVLYSHTGTAYIQGWIQGTKPVDYGHAALDTWLDRPEYE
jgi:hypothetical protein